MATRRFRIKAVANVSVSRGRCGEKPRDSENLSENTSSNSSTTSYSPEVCKGEGTSVEGASEITLVGKLPDGSSSNATLKNTPVHHLVQNPTNVSRLTCLETYASDCSTAVETADTSFSHLERKFEDTDIQQDHCGSRDVCLGDRAADGVTDTTVKPCIKMEVGSNSTSKPCIKKEEDTDIPKLGDSSSSDRPNTDTAGNSVLSAPMRLPRKRMKPTVSLSVVNRKAKEGPPMQIGESITSCKIEDNSIVQVENNLQVIERNSDLHKDIQPDGSGVIVSNVDHGTQISNSLWSGDQKKKDPEIVSQTCVQHVNGMTECAVERSEMGPNVMSVHAPVVEPSAISVTADTASGRSSVVSNPLALGKDTVNETAKGCGQLNSYRTRFIRPKPRLLDPAARHNRTGSFGSASESDCEKKSLSSISTVSPPWHPRLKTSRTRLNRVQAMETDKPSNVSGTSADESEDEHSSVSRATTISPPKKIARLDSDGGSDTSHSDFSQELAEESTSPVKKPSTKREHITKRKEYLRRIIEIKKEISRKVSDGKVNRSRLTMFDLIYYNPATNPMKSIQETGVKTSEPAPTNATESEKRLAEESVDEPETIEDEERSSTVPVPQVKVGPNGEIILDEQSLVIETTDAKKNWNDLQNSDVVMDYGTGTTTFNAYSKKRKTRTKDWSREETLRFYRALHTVGTDFLVMQSLFPKFSRKELKDRYKKEERINRALVEKALRNPLTFDLTVLKKEFELERMEEERRPTQPKKTVPKRTIKSNRRGCSLFAALDSTDKGKVRAERRKIGKQKIKVIPVKNSQKKPKETGGKLGKEMRKVDKKGSFECIPDSDSKNPQNGHADNKSDIPESACSSKHVRPTRSGRIPRPRIFEDFMTDDVEELYEETEVNEICDHVTVEDVCDPLSVEDVCERESVDVNQSDHENLAPPEDVIDDDDSESEEQNFVMAEDGLTVEQSQVNLGSVYSNVKPGTLIVLATESPDNPGHQIYRVFMVSNNSETVPVSVTNNQPSCTGDATNSVEMGTSTDPAVSESSTNDDSLRVSAESSS